MIGKFSASIVVFDADLEEVNSCLNALRKSAYFGKLFIVQNSEPPYLRNHFSGLPDVVFFHAPSNPGYGAGHNNAMFQAFYQGFTKHIVLNSDLSFDATDIDKLIVEFQLNKELGLVAPSVVYPNGDFQTTAKLLPNLFVMLFRAFFKNFKFTKALTKDFNLIVANKLEQFTAPYLSGCFMLIRLETAVKILGFDENIFMYAEDIDFSRRIGQIGKNRVYNTVCIVHAHREYTRKSYKMFLIHIWNMIYYFKKYNFFFDREAKIINQQTMKEIINELEKNHYI